ncbi:MAG: SGNH/GDSL hydrolase family protein [bacterium]
MRSRWRHAISNFLRLTLPTLAACFALGEIVFRTLVPAAESPAVVFDGAHGVVHYDPAVARTGVKTLGPSARTRARWRINDAGWNSSVEYDARRVAGRPLIAIIGDSFIEALQVDVDRNVGALVRQQLRGKADVYSFGMSGAPLSEYLRMSRYVVREFHPDIIVINVVHNDFDQSVRTLKPNSLVLQVTPEGGSFREVAPIAFEPDRVRRILAHSAVIRYLVLNCLIAQIPRRLAAALRNEASGENQWNANTDPRALLREEPLIRRSLAAIMRTVRAENPGTRIIYMMDAPRRDIYAGTLATSNLRWLTQMVRETAEANGSEFVDLTPTFAEYWSAQHRILNDPGDYHWNQTGHRLAAEALLRALSYNVFRY